ncbi:7412_t:CDS:2, partial [Dentiscutata heterogama]
HRENKPYFQEYLKKIDNQEHQEDKKSLQAFINKIDNQLVNFKFFDEKALKISNFFNYMINSAFVILSGLANLKAEIFLLIESLNDIDLENTHQEEINLSLDKTDEYLHKWANYCTNITDQFKEIHEDHNNLIKNIEDSLFFFAIQEEILDKIPDIKVKILYNSQELDKPKVARLLTSSKELKKEVYLNFFFIIGLKLVYDLTSELENTTSRLKLLDLEAIQKILEVWKTLSKELSKGLELVKNFKSSELYVKEWYLDYVVENLINID